MEFRTYIAFVFVLIVFDTIYNEVNGLEGRVCYIDGHQGCCSYYFDNNGICEECPIGFTPQYVCTPCPRGSFGNRCTDTCDCGGDEECDHVTGQCIHESTTEENTTHEDKFNLKDIPYYGFLCGGVVLGFLLNVCINSVSNKCIKKKTANSIDTEQGMSDDTSNDSKGNHSMSKRQTTNESTTASPTIMNTRGIIKGGDKKCNTSRGNQNTAVQDDNLNPYQPMMTDRADYHPYNDINGKENARDVSKERKVGQDDNLNPYQPILKNQVESHPYNQINSYL